jgi:hypothetical protein
MQAGFGSNSRWFRPSAVALHLPIRMSMTESKLAAIRRAAAGLLVVTACGASACDERLRNVAGPSPNLQPTFSSIQTEIFEMTDLAGRAACITCHTNQGRTPAQNLNLHLDPYAALVNVPSRERPGAVLVVPGDPESSYLIRKLEGRDINGVRMPFNTPPYLTDGQILVIRRWIETGAPRN